MKSYHGQRLPRWSGRLIAFPTITFAVAFQTSSCCHFIVGVSWILSSLCIATNENTKFVTQQDEKYVPLCLERLKNTRISGFVTSRIFPFRDVQPRLSRSLHEYPISCQNQYEWKGRSRSPQLSYKSICFPVTF